MSRPVVAIHQPNFFPWLGYFAKINTCDVFVVLDEVDYPKSGKSMGSYTNRVKLAVSGQARWWGCPAVRESGPQPINTVRINEQQDWRKRALSTLWQNYARAPFRAKLGELVEEMVNLDEPMIGAYNVANLKRVSGLLGLDAEFVLQSELGTTKHSTELLVEIVSKLGGKTYFSGTGGALSYQDDALFVEAGIEVAYSPFKPCPYDQIGSGEFLPGLSILDALLNIGPEATRALLG
jgi:hypothetical protein